MSKRTKVLLIISIIVTVYLVYIVGVGVVMPGLDDHFILHLTVGTNDRASTAPVLNWTGLLAIVMWIIWGVSFLKDE